jgi:hypothetical protein
MALVRRVRSWGREQRGSNVAQAAAVALVAAILIAVMISIGSQSLRPAAARAFNCLVAAISGGGAGCSGGPAAAQGPGNGGSTPASDSGGGEDDGGGGLGGWFSAGIDFIPVVGEVKGLIEVFTGTDLVTGEDLGAWRWAGLAGLIGLNEIKHLRHADEVVDAVGDIGRRGDDLNDGRRALDPCPIGAAPGKGRGLAAPLLACGRPVDPDLVAELGEQGIKHTPENIVAAVRDPSGRVVFLETGRGGPGGSGLAHIIERHGNQFAGRGITQDQLPDAIMTAVTEGRIVGFQGSGTGRPIYEFTFNGRTHHAAITVGENGYVVGANPVTWP